MELRDISDKQLKKMNKIFRKTGKTFQQVAYEAGLKTIPDHVKDLNREEARQILKTFGYCFVEGKVKQGV